MNFLTDVEYMFLEDLALSTKYSGIENTEYGSLMLESSIGRRFLVESMFIEGSVDPFTGKGKHESGLDKTFSKVLKFAMPVLKKSGINTDGIETYIKNVEIKTKNKDQKPKEALSLWERFKGILSDIGEWGKSFYEKIRVYVKENPYKSLGIVLTAIGIIAYLVIKQRDLLNKILTFIKNLIAYPFKKIYQGMSWVINKLFGNSKKKISESTINKQFAYTSSLYESVMILEISLLNGIKNGIKKVNDEIAKGLDVVKNKVTSGINDLGNALKSTASKVIPSGNNKNKNKQKSSNTTDTKTEINSNIQKMFDNKVNGILKILKNSKVSVEEKDKVMERFYEYCKKESKRLGNPNIAEIGKDGLRRYKLLRGYLVKMEELDKRYEEYKNRSIFEKAFGFIKKFGWSVPKRTTLSLVYKYTKMFYDKDESNKTQERLNTYFKRIEKLESTLEKTVKDNKDGKLDKKIFQIKELIEKNKEQISKANSDFIKQHWVPITITLIVLAVVIAVGIYYYKNKRNNKQEEV